MKTLGRLLLPLLLTSTWLIQSARAEGGYLGLEAGLAFADINADATAQALANASGQTVVYTYDSATFTGRLAAGFKFNEMFSAEIGYFATGDIGATYTGTTFSAVENFSANGFDFALLIHPASEGFFVKLGAHSSEVEGEIGVLTPLFNVTGTASVSGTGMLFGLGYDWSMGENDFLRASYTFYDEIGGLKNTEIGLLSVSYNIGF